MVSLYDQLVFEISAMNPNLSPEQISEKIVMLVQDEIIPDALKRITLPNLPSPVSVKTEELMSRRRRLSARMRTSLQAKASLIQELEKLRVQFDGSGLTNEDYFLDLTNDTQSPIGQKETYDIMPEKKTLSVEPSIPQERLESSPSLKGRGRAIKKPSQLIVFDSDISENISRDLLFERVIGAIESRIRRNYDRESLEIFFRFSIRTDIDNLDRKKTVIHINLPSHNFDEKMELWDKIESDIRDVIMKLNVTQSEKAVINRNIFTHVEPS